jgi:DNA-binding LacI/PurR family transcriptional regulator
MVKTVTLKMVADEAGVSYQTVSKVINNKANVSPETEKRILDVIRKLGYTPNHTAKSLREQCTKTIGYSWEPSPPDQTNPILDEFLQSMFRTAEVYGYYLLCFPFHHDEQKQVETYRSLFEAGRVDGFILSRLNYDDPCVNCLIENNVPFMAFGRPADSSFFPYIDVDGALGIKMVTEHLISMGHKKIGTLAWPEDSRVGNNRMEGYFSAMKEAGIEIESDWIRRGEGDYDNGHRMTYDLLELPNWKQPTAVIAMNDLMAIGAMAAIRSKGLTPGGDVAVTGFDDTPTARFLNPPLTTLRQPVTEIGRNLMVRFIRYLETGRYTEPVCELIAPELIIRESTTGIPAKPKV